MSTARRYWGGQFSHIIVYGQAGVDTVNVVAATIGGSKTPVAVPAILFGGTGVNNLSVAGSSANNILVGGPGADKLTGGSGRDILIGGGGSDTLVAGTGSDILIGGRTVYNVNLAALAALMAEWQSTDSYAERVADLFGNGSNGANGATYLSPATVTADAGTSLLIGSASLTWFFDTPGDKLVNPENGDVDTLL